MSLILDALNRSRQDDGQVPGLATQHYGPTDGDQGSGLKRAVPWTALAVALVVIAWLAWDRSQEMPPAPVAAPVIGTDPRPAPVTGPDPRPAPAATRRQAPAGDSLVVGGAAPAATAPRPAAIEGANKGSESTILEESAIVDSDPLIASAAPPDSAVAELYRDGAQQAPGSNASEEAAAPAAPPSTPETSAKAVDVGTPAGQAPAAAEEPVDIERMVTQAQNELRNARLEEHSAPFITELSQQTKNGIPTIYYQRHDYSGKPGASLVVLNGKSLRVGGSPGPGFKVKEILPDSVVLDYRGTEFRLRALNSWINL